MPRYSQQEREQLAVLVMDVLKEWNIRDEIQLELLGLPAKTANRELTKFSRGKALPDDEQLLQRVVHLLGIHHALGVVFPLNRKMAAFWLTTANRHFGGAPLTVMLEEGLSGMDQVWRHLDCTRNWE